MHLSVPPRIHREAIAFTALAALIAGHLAVKEADAQTKAPILENGNVIGHVIDEYQNPLAGLPVTMQDQTVYTDAQGNFTFNDAPVAVQPSSWGAIKTRYMDGTTGHMSLPSQFSPQSVSTSLDTLLINGGNANWSYRVPIMMDGSEQVVNVMLPGDDISNQEYREMHDVVQGDPPLYAVFDWGTEPTAFPLKYRLAVSSADASIVRQRVNEFNQVMGRTYFEEDPTYDFSRTDEGGIVNYGSNLTPVSTFAQTGLAMDPAYGDLPPEETNHRFVMGLLTVTPQTVYHELGRALGVRGAITGRPSVFDDNGESTIVPADVSLMNLTYDMHAFDLNDGSTVEFEWKNLEQ